MSKPFRNFWSLANTTLEAFFYSYSLNIKPDGHFLNWQQDPFGNYQARVVFPEKTKEFFIDVEIIADLITLNPFDFFVEESATNYPFEYKKSLKKELKPYLKINEKGNCNCFRDYGLLIIDDGKKLNCLF